MTPRPARVAGTFLAIGIVCVALLRLPGLDVRHPLLHASLLFGAIVSGLSCAGFIAAAAGSSVSRRLGLRVDERDFREAARPATRRAPPGRFTKVLVFPATLSVHTAQWVGVLGLRWAKRDGLLALDLLLMLLLALAATSVALYRHSRPDSGRRLKYEWLLTGVLALGYLVWGDTATRGYRGSVNASVLLVASGASLALLAVACLLLGAWLRPFDERAPSGREEGRLRRLHRATHGLLMVLGIPFWPVLLLIRYCAGERLAACPIVYLRSFHDARTPKAFGQIVARVARADGVLVALTHATQSPTVFHAETALEHRAHLSVVPEDAWRSWVLDVLARAHAVLLDASQIDGDAGAGDRPDGQSGVAWELQQARNRPSRLVVLLHVDSPEPVGLPIEAKLLRYDLDWLGPWRARRALRHWLRGLQ